MKIYSSRDFDLFRKLDTDTEEIIDALCYMYGISEKDAIDGYKNGEYTDEQVVKAIIYFRGEGLPKKEQLEYYKTTCRSMGIEATESIMGEFNIDDQDDVEIKMVFCDASLPIGTLETIISRGTPEEAWSKLCAKVGLDDFATISSVEESMRELEYGNMSEPLSIFYLGEEISGTTYIDNIADPEEI